MSQASKYYVMTWDIDPDYNIPPQTNFTFSDYLFGHAWSLIWDGDTWSGNNVVNNSYAKQSTYKNNRGRRYVYVQHTERIARWLSSFLEVSSDSNYSTALCKYIQDWRLVYSDGTTVELTESNSVITPTSSSQVTINDVPCDIHYFTIKLTDKVSSKHLLYIMADINIDDYIIPLRWDMHPVTPIDASYINTWDDSVVIESFRYERRVRHSTKIIEPATKKNINIYIEKDYFEQLPANADENYNPFETIIIQQFYEVTPDPRNCTTLTTDHNIYSSKIIWANNIMTMRQDLNVVGGVTDRLTYDYSLLMALMDSFQEQMRLQAAYNEHTDSIRKGLST